MVVDIPTRSTGCVLGGEISPAQVHSHFVYLPCAHLFAKELHKLHKHCFSPSLGLLPLQQAAAWKAALGQRDCSAIFRPQRVSGGILGQDTKLKKQTATAK